MTAMSPRARHSRIAAGLFLLSTAAGATALAAGPAAAAPASPASTVHAADQAPNPAAAPGNTVWD
ncbi:hypothetical protein ABIA31_000756 [Catenulispora sp. MAP5-51]|uniref:hypothetical protein n=1 Tax=Catenulispora sp. MAP5-51 TaxID=3156298 RepID=UPI0035118BF5